MSGSVGDLVVTRVSPEQRRLIVQARRQLGAGK
jgi:hypothetical protein